MRFDEKKRRSFQARRGEAGFASVTEPQPAAPRSGGVMRNVGMKYQYSYEEQWQPKDFPVIFRMYQLNLDGKNHPVYDKYWNQFPHHFIETDVRRHS